jgi:hypothetical protein
MGNMNLKRTAIHMDVQDMKILARIAHEETQATGIRVTAAGITRRLIKEFIRKRGTKN